MQHNTQIAPPPSSQIKDLNPPQSSLSWRIIVFFLKLVQYMVLVATTWAMMKSLYGFLALIAFQFFSSLAEYFYLSESFQSNLKILNMNGFSTSYVTKMWMFNLAHVFIAPNILMYYFTTSLDNVKFGFPLIIGIVGSFCCSELMFTLIHAVLHDKFAEMHQMHHCCTRAMMWVNLCFNPIDLNLEFAAASIAIWAFPTFVLKDPVVYTISMYIFMIWYYAGHDDYFRLSHWKHHAQCNTNFSVYIDTRGLVSRTENVKTVLKRQEDSLN